MGKVSEVLSSDKTETVLKTVAWVCFVTAAGIGASKTDEKTQRMFKKVASVFIKDKVES